MNNLLKKCCQRVSTVQNLYGNSFSISSCQFGDSGSILCFSHHRHITYNPNLSIKRCRFEKIFVSSSVIKPALVPCLQFYREHQNYIFEKMVLAPKIKLNNGQEMPVIGLGTYASIENDCEKAIKHALDIGYRHIDTAYFYQNEKEVGKAVRDKITEGVIKREDVYVVTKLWNTYHAPEKVEYACKKSLDNLDLDYIDLYLMHLPVGYAFIDDSTLLPKDGDGKLILSDDDYLDTYKAMEKLVEKGYVRSIGVSNFNSEQIERVLKNCQIKPVTNQVECHPAVNQKKLISFCKERDIVITAYCPIGRPNPEEKKPDYFYDERVIAMGNKYKKTSAQIVLRYLVDVGTVPIPKSVNNKRIEENFDIFDFKLTDEEIKIIDSCNSGERLVPFNLVKACNHKYFPFNIEY